MIKLTVFILLCASLPLPSSYQDNKLKLHNSQKAMKQEIQKIIPVSSDIEEAKKLMEANGFSCSLKQDTSFMEWSEKDEKVLHNNLDFLYCDKELPINQYCARRWQIAIAHEHGKVSDIYVSIGSICV